jgi:hypothetical protein
MTGSLYTQKPPAGRPRVLLEQDKSFGVQNIFYQIVCILGRECYNPATMRFEPSSNSILYIGVRGFIGEGLLGIAPAAQR